MRCDRAQEQFSDYHEGTLGRSFVVALEKHLEDCSSCRNELAELKSVWQILDEAQVVEPPFDFRAQVWRRIDEAEQAKSRRPAFTFNWRSLISRPAMALAAAALLIVVLARIVLPGTQAGLGFLVSPFSGSRGATFSVTALPTQMRMIDAEQVLVVPLKTNGSTAGPAEVRVVTGPAVLDQRSSVIDLGGPTNPEVLLHLQPGSSGQTVTLEVRAQNQGRELTSAVEIKAP